MSFSVALVKYRDGDAVAFSTEPVVRILEEHGIDERGAEYVELRDGLSIDLDTSLLSAPTIKDLGISFRHVSPALFDLLYDLARADGLTIIVFGSQTAPLVIDESTLKDLPSGFDAPPVVCKSASDLAAAVTGPFEAWRRWVDG